SGQMCTREVQHFLIGTASAEQLRSRYTQQWNDEFISRLRLASALQSLALRPRLLQLALAVFRRVPALGKWAVRNTRGG
ncbi:MAG: hypothetical protein LC737_03645, partial [Chloroflexi bacterium]|nr:hypothetical protein [Chloroflexota bacterium]